VSGSFPRRWILERGGFADVFDFGSFFYADERTEDGKLKGMALDAGAHADFYAGLAEHVGDVPWHATFTKGKGYVHFE
jgi:hypothetical protein